MTNFQTAAAVALDPRDTLAAEIAYTRPNLSRSRLLMGVIATHRESSADECARFRRSEMLLMLAALIVCGALNLAVILILVFILIKGALTRERRPRLPAYSPDPAQ